MRAQYEQQHYLLRYVHTTVDTKSAYLPQCAFASRLQACAAAACACASGKASLACRHLVDIHAPTRHESGAACAIGLGSSQGSSHEREPRQRATKGDRGIVILETARFWLHATASANLRLFEWLDSKGERTCYIHNPALPAAG